MKNESSVQLLPSQAEETSRPATRRNVLPPGFPIFLALFFLSGMCALVYEIAWTRRLTLVFGNTVYSVSTVLVAFMGGLAFGSMWFGRIIDRRKDPIRTYAWLEIGIGVSAILLPLALSALNPAYRFLYGRVGASNYVMSLVRFGLSTAVMIIPTTLMGATLPVLSKFIVRRIDRTGLGIGSLYAINTLGAMVGCFLAGFVLLGWIGITCSERLAASLNILIGVAAFGLCRRLGQIPSNIEEIGEKETNADAPMYQPGTLHLVLVIFGVSGMLALAYEVLWTRILVVLLGSSIYSFSMILAVYLLGLTAGSLLLARAVDRLKRPLHVFGWVEIFIGASVLAGLLLFRWLPFQEYSLNVTPTSYFHTNLVSILVVVLPPTLLMGATFPLAVRIYARSLGAIGRQTGTLYAVNTLGAILGSFASGFVLIPLLGSKNSMMLLILLSVACGFLLLRLSVKQEGAATLNWLVGALLIFPISGFFLGDNMMKELFIKASKEESARVVAFDEDATAAVAVLEYPRELLILSVNGHAMTVLCTETQLMAHIPLALAPNPQSVLNICFGMGTTFVSARRAGMKVDFVELCPYVVETFKYFQSDPRMLHEPGVGKIIADGRNHLLLSDKTYDLITIDPPPPPWSAGTVNLYTEEFYELCKKRLNPGGIVCQWLPTTRSALSEEQYKMLVRTFMVVFPHISVWGSPNNIGTFLIATPEPLQIHEDSFNAYFDDSVIRNDLALYSNRAVAGPLVLSLLLLEEDAVRRYVADAPVMRDDLPLIEFPLFRNNLSKEIMRVELLYHRAE